MLENKYKAASRSEACATDLHDDSSRLSLDGPDEDPDGIMVTVDTITNQLGLDDEPVTETCKRRMTLLGLIEDYVRVKTLSYSRNYLDFDDFKQLIRDHFRREIGPYLGESQTVIIALTHSHGKASAKDRE